MTAYTEFSLTTSGHRVRIADLTVLHLTAHLTEGLYRLANRVIVDANGYELFNCPLGAATKTSPVDLPETIAFDAKAKTWIAAISGVKCDLMFDPLRPSGRYFRLRRIEAT